jgi:hypothetical protein
MPQAMTECRVDHLRPKVIGISYRIGEGLEAILNILQELTVAHAHAWQWFWSITLVRTGSLT